MITDTLTGMKYQDVECIMTALTEEDSTVTIDDRLQITAEALGALIDVLLGKGILQKEEVERIVFETEGRLQFEPE